MQQLDRFDLSLKRNTFTGIYKVPKPFSATQVNSVNMSACFRYRLLKLLQELPSVPS